MNALENVHNIISKTQVEKVVINDRVVSRGYVFWVEKDNKNYILVHPKDWDMAIAQVYMSEKPRPRLSDYLQGVPVFESYPEALLISQGVYKCSYQVK